MFIMTILKNQVFRSIEGWMFVNLFSSVYSIVWPSEYFSELRHQIQMLQFKV